MSYLLVAQRGLTVPGWVKDALWRAAKATPSLDLPFADSKSLVDAITGRQLISYARAGSGTYTDSTGTLRTAAVDEPRFDHKITSTTTNLAIRSEEFDNATWVQTGLNAFGSGSVANAIAAPDGTVTGDLIEEDTSTGFHRVSQTLISGTISTGTYTASVYVKAAQRSRAYISLDDNATGEVTAGFATLTQAFTITTAGSWSGSTASIEDVGNGWFRISLTSTKGDGSSALTLHVGIAQVSTTTISYTGNGTAGLYVWGAQLVASDSNGRYVRTTAAAASFSTTGSLGLLVEEQRTNLLTYSENLTLGFTQQNTTVTSDATAAPDGTTTADLSVPNTTSASHASFRTNITFAVSTSYALSVFVKPSGYTNFQLAFTSGFNNTNAWANFVLVGGGSLGFTGTSGTAAIQALRDGWYRCSLVAPSGASATTGGPAVLVLDSNRNSRDPSFAGDGISGAFLWGAQLEAGATASSYIPTTTAAATRSADVAQITGTNFSSWYRQDEGTVYAEALTQEYTVTTFPRVFSIDDGGAASSFIALVRGSNTRRWDYSVFANGTGQAVGLNNGISPSAGAVCRGAVIYRANDFTGATQGVLMNADTSGIVPTVNALGIGMQSNATLQFNGHIRRLTYWPQALPGQLQAITQP